MKITILRLFKYLKYIPITIYVNIRLKCAYTFKQPFFPIIITSRLKLYCDSSARIKANPGSYLRLGYGSGGIATFAHTGINFELHELAEIKLEGVSIIGYGSSICVYKNGVLKIGDGTYMAGYSNIKCANEIQIGNNCSISWNVTILDSDFHPWSIKGEAREISSPIIIEDHVWIGNNSIILKGVTIGAGSIIGAGSVVTKSVPKNTMVAGNPARIIHHEIEW